MLSWEPVKRYVSGIVIGAMIGLSVTAMPFAAPSVASAQVVQQVTGKQVVAQAKRYVGVKYEFGGESSKSMDASGLMYRVFKDLGIDAPRTLSPQSSFGKRVSRSQAQPGDVVFFTEDGKKPFFAGIYIGNDQMIASAPSTKGVAVRKITTSLKNHIYSIQRWTSPEAASSEPNAQPQKPSNQSDATADQIINFGLKYLGVPYVFGAKAGQTKSFDCSSFTQYVYGHYGISLPRLANSQKQVGKSVSFNNLKKGDLMFFHTGFMSVSNDPNRADHVGIYMGDNKILHTTPSGGGVNVTKINSYWKKTFIIGKRVL